MTNFSLLPVMWDETPESKIQSFEERQYRHAYLMRMHELLNDRSERTLADIIDHIPPMIV